MRIKGWKKTKISSQGFSPVLTEPQKRAENEELWLKQGDFPFWFKKCCSSTGLFQLNFVFIIPSDLNALV